MLRCSSLRLVRSVGAPRLRLFSSPSADDKLKTLSDGVRASIASGVTELQREFGGAAGAHAEKVWASEYYRHGLHKYAVPALSLASADAATRASAAFSTKNVVFFGNVLAGLPDGVLGQYAAALSLAEGIDIGLFVASMRVANTPTARSVFERMGASVRRSGNKSLAELMQNVAAAPVAPASTWAFPHLGSAADVLGARENAPTAAWEISPLSKAARESTTPAEFALIAGTCVLEGLWAEFYATGSVVPLRRILELALAWAEFASTSEAVVYLVNIERPLPGDLAFSADLKGDAATRAIRAAVGRAAIWSLVHHSRRHPRVVATLAEACGALADSIAAPSAREGIPSKEWAGLSSADRRAALEVWPPLLHLIARGALDTPFDETTAA